MVAITISIQELINFLKVMVKQKKRFPKFFLGNLIHDGSGLIFNLPREGEESIPIDMQLDFHEQTVEVSVDPDREQPLGIVTVTVEESFHILLHNDRKIRKLLGQAEYNKKKKYFQQDFKPGNDSPESEEDTLYEEPFRLLSKVIPLRGNKMRLRIASK